MIHINLVPGAKKKKASSKPSFNFASVGAGLSGRVKDKLLIGAVVSVVLAVLAVGYLYTSQIAFAGELEARKDRAIADSARYANFLKDRYHAESVRDTLLRQVNIIKSLDEDRYVWSHVVDEVSRALPQYTWLTAIAYNGTPQGSVNVVATPKVPAPDTVNHKNLRPKRTDTASRGISVSMRFGKTWSRRRSSAMCSSIDRSSRWSWARKSRSSSSPSATIGPTPARFVVLRLPCR